MARDIKDELEEISRVFQKSDIKDEDFDATLEELHGFMCDL